MSEAICRSLLNPHRELQMVCVASVAFVAHAKAALGFRERL